MNINNTADDIIFKLAKGFLMLPLVLLGTLSLCAFFGLIIFNNNPELALAIFKMYIQNSFGFELKLVHFYLLFISLGLLNEICLRIDCELTNKRFDVNIEADSTVLYLMFFVACAAPKVFGFEINEILKQHVLFFVIFSFAFIAIIYTYINSIQIMNFWLKAFGYREK